MIHGKFVSSYKKYVYYDYYVSTCISFEIQEFLPNKMKHCAKQCESNYLGKALISASKLKWENFTHYYNQSNYTDYYFSYELCIYL